MYHVIPTCLKGAGEAAVNGRYECFDEGGVRVHVFAELHHVVLAGLALQCLVIGALGVNQSTLRPNKARPNRTLHAAASTAAHTMVGYAVWYGMVRDT